MNAYLAHRDPTPDERTYALSRLLDLLPLVPEPAAQALKDAVLENGIDVTLWDTGTVTYTEPSDAMYVLIVNDLHEYLLLSSTDGVAVLRA